MHKVTIRKPIFQFSRGKNSCCQILKTILFHEFFHDRIRQDLSKAVCSVGSTEYKVFKLNTFFVITLQEPRTF